MAKKISNISVTHHGALMAAENSIAIKPAHRSAALAAMTQQRM